MHETAALSLSAEHVLLLQRPPALLLYQPHHSLTANMVHAFIIPPNVVYEGSATECFIKDESGFSYGTTR